MTDPKPTPASLRQLADDPQRYGPVADALHAAADFIDSQTLGLAAFSQEMLTLRQELDAARQRIEEQSKSCQEIHILASNFRAERDSLRQQLDAARQRNERLREALRLVVIHDDTGSYLYAKKMARAALEGEGEHE